MLVQGSWSTTLFCHHWAAAAGECDTTQKAQFIRTWSPAPFWTCYWPTALVFLTDLSSDHLPGYPPSFKDLTSLSNTLWWCSCQPCNKCVDRLCKWWRTHNGTPKRSKDYFMRMLWTNRLELWLGSACVLLSDLNFHMAAGCGYSIVENNIPIHMHEICCFLLFLQISSMKYLKRCSVVN